MRVRIPSGERSRRTVSAETELVRVRGGRGLPAAAQQVRNLPRLDLSQQMLHRAGVVELADTPDSNPGAL